MDQDEKTYKREAEGKLDQVVSRSPVGSPGRVSRSSVINALPGICENVQLFNEPIVIAGSGPDIIGRVDRFRSCNGDRPVRNIPARVCNFVTNREIPSYSSFELDRFVLGKLGFISFLDRAFLIVYFLISPEWHNFKRKV